MRALLAVILIWEAASGTDPVVRTPLGKIRGSMMTSRGGREFLAFCGVPYAEPPDGQLAFEAPRPKLPWAGIINATCNVHGPWCIQYNIFEITTSVVGQQDCLYLSVYTHDVYGYFPVMVHFHGGGFIAGHADLTGPQFLMDKSIVVVNANYRVGVFGFLSFGDKDMPGNQGMKDQVQSMRWVQQNIASFGGDPNRVTLVGESAGAASNYHHIVSPLTHGLFHGVIAESGSSYAQWALHPQNYARNHSMMLLGMVGCNYTSTREAVDCLRSKDPTEVASKVQNFVEWQVDPGFVFGPVLEPPGPDAFLVGPISEWQHKRVPLLTGTTSAEGLFRTVYFFWFGMSFEWYSENFEKVSPFSLFYRECAPNPDEITSMIRELYFQSKEITFDDWENITTMYSDGWFSAAIMEGADKHTGDVYFYVFDYMGDKGLAGDPETRNETIFFGPTHNEEAIYIWKFPNNNNFEGKDLRISEKLVTIWTNFAKHGNPDPAGKLNWAKWTPDRHRYMNISNEGFNMEEGFAEDRYRFWKSIPYREKLYY